MRRVLPLAIALLFTQIVLAQYSVGGTIRDQQAGLPLGRASVRLRSAAIAGEPRSQLTDSLGRFLFQNLPADSFLLTVSFVGYKDFTRGVRLDSTNVKLDSLGAGALDVSVALAPGSSQNLATVVITAKTPLARQKEDTLEFNASQLKVNPDASAEDLARKVPGITIQNGQVTANGETVQKVTIDGRDLFGNDATAALRNLPAEIIDKIQVFDRLSDQAQLTGVDDGNTNKGINIVTKVNMRNGQFGRVYAGYGTDDRYLVGGNATILKNNRRISLVGNFNNVNQQNFAQQDLLGVTSSGGRGGPGGGGGGARGGGGPGGGGGGFQGGGGFGGGGNFTVGAQNGINRTNALGINFSDVWGKKLTVTGSYFFNDTKNNTNQVSNTQYFTGSYTNTIDSTRSESRNQNHRLNLRVEWRIDSFNTLTFIPNLSFQNNRSTRQTISNIEFVRDTSGRLRPIQTLVTNVNDATVDGNNLSNALFYRHMFRKRGRSFSVSLNTSYNDRQGDTYYNTFQRDVFTTSNFKDSVSNRYTDQANNSFTISPNVNYTEPLSEKAQLQFSYSPRFTKSESNQQTFQQNPTTKVYTDFLNNYSNVLKNSSTAQIGGITYRWGDRDRMISFGANYQNTNLKSDQSYPVAVKVDKSFSALLPNAMVRYKLSTRSSFRVFYRANVNDPSVTQLQAVLDPTNAPNYTLGNVNLNQQYMHIGSLQYTYTNTGKGFLVVGNLFYQAANNYITNAAFTPRGDTTVAGVKLPFGSRISTPVNLDGYQSMRSFLTLAVPVGFLKSNFNLNGGVSYTKTPGINNNILNESKNTTYTLGSVIASNVSQYVDFTVSYSANFNKVVNSVQLQQNNNYFQHVASVQMNLLSKTGWFFQTDVTNQYYSGLSAGFNQNYFLWNMSAGKKVLKNQKGEIKISVFDLLKQNQSITRNITANYIEDVRNQVLQQYFMLHFTYNLRNFGTAAARSFNHGEGGGGFGFPGGPGGPPRF